MNGCFVVLCCISLFLQEIDYCKKPIVQLLSPFGNKKSFNMFDRHIFAYVVKSVGFFKNTLYKNNNIDFSSEKGHAYPPLKKSLSTFKSNGH